MRIAVFSDIHGNPYACQAVLDALAADGEFDAIVAAGDLCYGGSAPGRCIDLLQAAGVQAIVGNTDEFILHPDQSPPDEMHRAQWPQISLNAQWAAGQLTAEQLAWLAALPFELRFSPTERAKDDLLIVHANPKNTHDFILPPMPQQPKVAPMLPQPDDDPTLVSLLHDVSAAVIAFGHLHFTTQRLWQDKLLVNVSPCSVAPYDHDRRSRYTIFRWAANGWTITRRLVNYDFSQEAAALRASDMPEGAQNAAHFE